MCLRPFQHYTTSTAVCSCLIQNPTSSAGPPLTHSREHSHHRRDRSILIAQSVTVFQSLTTEVIDERERNTRHLCPKQTAGDVWWELLQELCPPWNLGLGENTGILQTIIFFGIYASLFWGWSQWHLGQNNTSSITSMVLLASEPACLRAAKCQALSVSLYSSLISLCLPTHDRTWVLQQPSVEERV